MLDNDVPGLVVISMTPPLSITEDGLGLPYGAQVLNPERKVGHGGARATA